jgi:AAA+ ATPase superfamily predicted ATPase
MAFFNPELLQIVIMDQIDNLLQRFNSKPIIFIDNFPKILHFLQNHGKILISNGIRIEDQFLNNSAYVFQSNPKSITSPAIELIFL